jgi:NIMA (never in mitosis gene a)-related kinase
MQNDNKNYYEDTCIVKATVHSFSPLYKAYLIVDKHNTSKYFLKKVLNISPKENAKAYASLLEFDNNKYLTNIYEIYYKDEYNLVFITEYFPITLKMFLQQRRKEGKYLQQIEVINIFTQLCIAVKYLHDNNINYRVLDTEHVYIKADKHVKLADTFEMKVLRDYPDSITDIGNALYKCVETYLLRPYTCKSDVWSLGVMLYELVSYKLPFTLNDLNEMKCIKKVNRNKVMNGLPKYMKENNKYNLYIVNLIFKMLEIDTTVRYDVNDVLKYVYNHFVKDNLILKTQRYEWVGELKKMFDNVKPKVIRHNYTNPLSLNNDEHNNI